MTTRLAVTDTPSLQNTLTKLDGFRMYFESGVRSVPGAGFVNAAKLFDPAATGLYEILRRMSATDPCDEYLLATTALATYSWPIVATAMFCFLVDQSVPDISLDKVDLCLDETSRPVEISFRSRRVAVLEPGGYSNDQVTALADLNALRSHLHESLERHFEPVVMRIRELLPIGGNAAWWTVGDRLVQAVAWIHRHATIGGATIRLPPQVNVADEVDLFAGRRGSPFFNEWSALRLGVLDATQINRASCCLRFRTPCGICCGNCPMNSRRRVIPCRAAE